MSPKVSICIPTYRQIEFLRKTLDSVLMQDFQDYEVIITDDTPDDTVKKLIDTYDFGGRLQYWHNKTSLGSPENWNQAVRYASGEYIKMLHHDDYFTYDSSLAAFVEMLDNHPEADFAFCSAFAVNVLQKKNWIHSATKAQLQMLQEDSECLFFGNFIGPPSSTIYRNTYNLAYDIKLKWVVDIDFYIHFLHQNRKFAFTDSALITSVSGGYHNVTNECENIKEVEVFEYLYLFDKIIKGRYTFPRKYIYFFTRVFDKYNIQSVKEIRSLGYSKRLPFLLVLLLLYRRVKYDI